MTKDDWIRKLTSRKFWAAVAGFVTGLIIFLKSPTTDGNAITALIMSLGSLIAYIIGEGLIDAAGAGADQYYLDVGGEDSHPPEDKGE